MYLATVDPGWSLQAWRDRARAALAAGVPPEHLQWDSDAQLGLALASPLPDDAGAGRISVPAALVDLAGAVVCHRDPGRHALAMWLCGHDGSGDPDATQPSLLLALNGGEVPVAFDLPRSAGGRPFRVVLDSAGQLSEGATVPGTGFTLEGHALCLLEADPERSPEPLA